jgi:hypothetical protein
MGDLIQKMRFLLEADASGAVKGFEKVGKTADRELLKAQNRMDKVGAGLTKFGAGAVAASGLVGAGLFKAAGAFQDLAIEAGKFSDATGVAVEDASRWIEVAGDMGVEAGTVESALGKLNKTLATSPDKVKALGVEIVRTADGLVDTNATFLNAIDTLNAMEDPAEKAAAATALFGRGWQSMSELIATGSDNLTASLAAVSDAKVINEDELAKAKAFREAMDTLGDSVEDLVISIGQGAAPVIGALADAAGGAISAFSGLNAITDGMVGQIAAVGTVALAAAGSVAVIAGKVIQLRTAFQGLPAAAKGAAGAVGAVAIAYMAYEASKSQAVTSSEEVVAALKAEADGHQRLADETMASWLVEKEINGLRAGSMISAAEAMEGYGLSAAEVITALRNGVVPAVDLAGSRAGAFAMQWKELEEIYGKSKTKFETAAVAVSDLAVAEDDATTEAVSLKAALDPLAASGENLAGWLGKAAEKQEQLNAAFQAAVESVFGLPEAEDAYAESLEAVWAAQVKLNEAKAKGDGGAETQAARDLEGAYRTQAEAAGELAVKQSGVTDATQAAAIKQQAMIRELEKVRASVAPGSPLYKEISGYIALLLNVPKNVNTRLNVTRGSVPGAKYDSKGNIIGFGVGATGGIVTRPTMALIGEAGPEAVVPLNQMPGASPLPAGGGGGITINVTAGMGADGRSIGQAVVQAIRDYERSNGRVFAAA